MKNNGTERKTYSKLSQAAQEQAIRTNLIKANIDNRKEDIIFRMCSKVNETISHLTNKMQQNGTERMKE